MVPWHSDYELGIEQIDTEHRHILDIINSLVPGDGSEIDSEMFDHIIERLAVYVDRHFRSEEDVLNTAGYSGAEHHMRSHNHFNARVNDWRGWDTQDIEGLHRSLVQWLIDHIQKEDSTFVPHVLDWLHKQKTPSHSA